MVAVVMGCGGTGLETAPNIAERSVQGEYVELGAFRGRSSVLVVFYRMHS